VRPLPDVGTHICLRSYSLQVPSESPRPSSTIMRDASGARPVGMRAFEGNADCSCKPVRYAVAGGPNQVVSASWRPTSDCSPTQATYPSGRINTAVEGGTVPTTGSSHTPKYLTSIDCTRSAHGVMSNLLGSPRLRSTGRASCSRVNTRSVLWAVTK